MPIINYLAWIHFDFGAVEKLPGEVARLGLKRPLLVTDPGLVEVGHAARVSGLLPDGSPVYAQTPSNPTERAALDALEIYRAENCDGLVSLGGGSAVDLAKAVALLATHEGALGDYRIKGGGAAKIGEVAPLIAVPTGAGTGAEVGRACSMTLNDGVKIACVSETLISKVVICDPELTFSLPRRFTGATGMDALCHGIECFISSPVNPPAGAIARDCVIRASKWLKTAADEPDNRQARWEMMMAALEGGLALQKGLGAIHAATLPLGAFGHNHGELNAVVMPHVIAFNRAHAADGIAELERAAGLEQPLEEWCAHLREYLGLPRGLAAFGFKDEQLPDIAAQAATEHLNHFSPKPLDEEEMLAILRQSM